MLDKPETTRILLIDDHALFRAGLAMLLQTGLRDIEIVQVGSINEALLMHACLPDIVLLDVMLPGVNGLEGLVLVKQKWQKAAVIMLSAQLQPKIVKLALSRGAQAFISKAEDADKIIALIHQIAVDKSVSHMPADTSLKTSTEQAVKGNFMQSLSSRQCEVLELICHGLSNKMISKRLHISDNTVHWHVRAILSILQVKNRSEAAFAARKLGVFD